MCQGCVMNCKNYRAYVKNKQSKHKKVLAITAESLEEVKKLLKEKQYNVEKVDELIFITSDGKTLATFNVSEFIYFGKISD